MVVLVSVVYSLQVAQQETICMGPFFALPLLLLCRVRAAKRFDFISGQLVDVSKQCPGRICSPPLTGNTHERCESLLRVGPLQQIPDGCETIIAVENELFLRIRSRRRDPRRVVVLGRMQNMLLYLICCSKLKTREGELRLLSTVHI